MRMISGSTTVPTELVEAIGAIGSQWQQLQLRSVGTQPEVKVPEEWVRLGNRRLAFVFVLADVVYDVVIDQMPTIESGMVTSLRLQKHYALLLTVNCNEDNQYFAKDLGTTEAEIAKLQKSLDALTKTTA